MNEMTECEQAWPSASREQTPGKSWPKLAQNIHILYYVLLKCWNFKIVSIYYLCDQKRQ